MVYTIINALRIIVSRYGFISLIVLYLVGANQAMAARDAGEKRECATCHIMWIKDFKRKDVNTLIPYNPMPVEKTGKQDVVSTEKMCFSCHDGFVLDSRKSWKKGSHGHPVGMKPSRKIKIPTKDGKTVFPLNEDGKVYCGTCHTAHGVSWSEKDSPVFMRVRNAESGLCLACHLDKSTGPAEGNHPVFKTMHKPLSEKLKVMGAQSGDKNTVICQTCHVAHGAQTSKSHLVVNPENDRLCSVCHEDKQSIIDSKHDLRKSHPDAKNIKGHTAANLGVCSSCHVPHGANGPSLWAGQEADSDVDVTAAACLGCHSKDGVAKEKALTKYNHPVGMPITSTGIDVVNGKWKSDSVLDDPEKPLISLPLYDKHGKHVENNGDVGCGSCHDPHKKSLADDKEAAGEKSKHKQVDFLRITENSGSKLCVNCHIKERAILLSKHNPEIYQPDDEIDSNVCASCHQVHHATTSPLWARGLGPGQASVESLCNDCHRKEGIAEKKLTGEHSHPVSVAAQNMSKSGLPLYGRNEANSGSVVDCATCHNLHQWDPVNASSQQGATMDVDGDGSTSFLRINAITGKLCIDCHYNQGWVLGTEHDLNITAPDAQNSHGKKVHETGVCGQCHLVHNASGESFLWARDVMKEDPAINGLCTSCHADDRPGKYKQPHNSKHPDDIKIWNQKVRVRYGRKTEDELPVYSKDVKSRSMGVVACPTCHDVHKWWTDKKAVGPKKNTEGNVTNSFLRVRHTSNMVCSDCHGKEALFRYKYFHSETTHKKYWFSR